MDAFLPNQSPSPPEHHRLGADELTFSVCPPPPWVELLPVEQASAEPGEPVVNLYVSEQYDLPSASQHTQWANQVLTQQGVQHLSQLAFEYDPAFQDLAVHHIDIVRSDDTVELADPSHFKLLQRETGLENLQYQGSLSALILLEDVRRNDIIRVSYTITDREPRFGGRFFGFQTLERPFPAKRLQFSVRKARDRKIPTHVSGIDLQPEIAEEPGGEFLRVVWERQDVPSQNEEEFTPSWHIPVSFIQWSEFRSWREVANLYARKWDALAANPDSDYEELVARLSESGDTPARRAEAAIAFVRNDIRYLSADFGNGGHMPERPSAVAARRFGDCKDKALLLSDLLTRMGFQAWPVLVNTALQQSVAALLPSPGNFNHVIVEAEIAGCPSWIDATLHGQHNDPERQVVPDYRLGLRIDERREELVEIPGPREGQSGFSMVETFAVRSDGRSATLRSFTKYTGLEADGFRNRLDSMGRQAISKGFEDAYRGFYPGVLRVGEFAVRDRPEENEITVDENFQIDDFGKADPDKKGYNYQLVASAIVPYLPSPHERDRKTPVALPFPCEISHRASIAIPGLQLVPIETKRIEGPGFDFSVKSVVNNGNATIDYRFVTTTDHVPVERYAEFQQKAAKACELMGHTIWHNPAAARVLRSSGSGVQRGLSGAGIFVLIVVGFQIIRMATTPRPEFSPADLKLAAESIQDIRKRIDERDLRRLGAESVNGNDGVIPAPAPLSEVNDVMDDFMFLSKRVDEPALVRFPPPTAGEGVAAEELFEKPAGFSAANNALLESGLKPALLDLEKARAARAQGDMPEAVRSYERALEKTPYDLEVFKELGEVYFSMGRRNAIPALIGTALERRPDSSDHLATAARFSLGINEFADAERYARRALERNQFDVDSLKTLAVAENQLADYLASLAAIRKAVEYAPDRLDLALVHGQSALLSGEYEEGLAAFQRILERDPRNVEALNGTGVAWQRAGDTAKAVSFYRTAVEADPKYLIAWENLATLLPPAEAAAAKARVEELRASMPR